MLPWRVEFAPPNIKNCCNAEISMSSPTHRQNKRGRRAKRGAGRERERATSGCCG